jgi:NADH-quinone oxidoreductase subunit C
MSWRDDLQALRDDGFDVLDWLSATDEGDEVVVTACLIRSGDPGSFRLVRSAAPVPSVVDMFPSAQWHERETAEMFGVAFQGLDAAPLLLPPDSPAPLRKAQPLPARLAQWPGEVDPAKPRRRQDPPGTPWR